MFRSIQSTFSNSHIRTQPRGARANAALVEALEHRQHFSFTETFNASAANFTAIDGTWSILNQKYRVHATSQTSITHLNARSVRTGNVTADFTATVTANVAATTSAWNDFALVFAYQDASNYSYFSSNESNDGATSGIIKVVNGVVTEVADIPAPITAATNYQVKLVRAGNTVTAYRNNVLLATATDAAFSGGRIGLGTARDQVDFDELVVTTVTPTTVPAAPSSLLPVAVSASQIDLGWADNANNESGYVVERANNITFTSGLVTTSLPANTTSHQVTGLSASSTYYFRVRATNAAGSSGYSSTVQSWTHATSYAKPGPTNTGPTNPSILVNRGNITASTAGSVIENVNVSGIIYVNADNVTIRNFRINAQGQPFAIRIASGVKGTVIQDGEIQNFGSAVCYGFTHYVARRLNVHHSQGDAFKADSTVLIESCWIHNLGTAANAHADGVQVSGPGAAGVVIRGNFIDMKYNEPGSSHNAAVFVAANNGYIANVTIEKNWLNGGNYTIFNVWSSSDSYPAPVNTRILDNRFGRDYQYGVWSLTGTTVTRSGNVWDDTGVAIP
jgi:hypothetical protein